VSSKSGFSDSISNRYALALYELCDESSELEKVEKHSKGILELFKESEDFRSLVENPTNKNDDQIKVIKGIADKFSFSEIFFKFLCFVALKRRFFFIKKILNSFLEICSKKRGEVKAMLKSSKELNPLEIEKIQKELSESFNSKVKLNYILDEKLIGGLIIQVGSVMVDTSIKNKLKQIESKLIEA
jgi:F-type H+-transporting ATPase subunit delta